MPTSRSFSTGASQPGARTRDSQVASAFSGKWIGSEPVRSQLSLIRSTATATSSVTCSRLRSSGEILSVASGCSPIQSSRPCQYPESDQDDGELAHLVGLDQRERLEQLVERAEPAGEEDESLRSLHQHHLAGVEVAEGEGEVEKPVGLLLVRELDVEADREAPGLLRASVGCLHHAGAAAGDHREAGLGQQPAAQASAFVVRVAGVRFAPIRTPSRQAADAVHGLEALQQLLCDQGDVRRVVGDGVLENASVFHA